MKKIIDAHKWFFKMSPEFMKGYSKFHYWTHLPKAYLKFMYFTLHHEVIELNEKNKTNL